MAGNDSVNTEDILRIMISTDNHLGYGEKDPIRGEDSFIAFEEMLRLAVEEDVDLILLGGDLFHDAVPSQNALHKCIKLLRQYTFGNKPISLEIFSDQTINFHNAVNETVNYEDPNLNISIPVFSIHGNHDDPSGFGRLSSLDLLATTGLVNYFGRWMDLTKVEINPILIRKEETQLALYGLSHIHDARLARLFENNKVTFNCPDAEEGEYFHLMVLHQNRADRGPKNYLPEELLPNFLNFIIWGHEHDCRIEPEYNHKQGFYVCQPGSSVPTSLAEGESLKKFVGVLEIYKTKFKLKPLPLKTVRPFVFESFDLTEKGSELGLDEGDASNKVKQLATEHIDAMIERSKELLTGDPKQPKLPLIRLRLVFRDEDHMFNAIRFGQTYNEKVANPADIIHFKKQIKRVKLENVKFDKDAMNSAFKKMEIQTSTRVEDLVDRYFEEVNDTKNLQLMPSQVLSEMCGRLVERRDANAAENILKFYKEKAVEYLMERLPSEDGISEQLMCLKEKITQDEILKMLDERGSVKPKGTNQSQGNDFLFKKSEEEFPTTSGTTRKRKVIGTDDNSLNNLSVNAIRGRGRGRGSREGNPTSTRELRKSNPVPKLEVTISLNRTSRRKQSLLETISQRQPSRQRKQNPVYEISDDSE